MTRKGNRSSAGKPSSVPRQPRCRSHLSPESLEDRCLLSRRHGGPPWGSIRPARPSRCGDQPHQQPRDERDRSGRRPALRLCDRPDSDGRGLRGPGRRHRLGGQPLRGGHLRRWQQPRHRPTAYFGTRSITSATGTVGRHLRGEVLAQPRAGSGRRRSTPALLRCRHTRAPASRSMVWAASTSSAVWRQTPGLVFRGRIVVAQLNSRTGAAYWTHFFTGVFVCHRHHCRALAWVPVPGLFAGHHGNDLWHDPLRRPGDQPWPERPVRGSAHRGGLPRLG